MNKLLSKIATLFVFCMIFPLFFIAGCSGVIGHGVMLWSLPEYGIADGDIVPVYLRSNIGKVYGIGVPGTDQKIEIPLWQITEPESQRKAQETAQRYKEYQYKYASLKTDGLFIRVEAVNTAKEVYRLKKNEIIKILYKGRGQPVMRGGEALEGDWFRVLTSDGTVGWCFSYNLSIFDDREGLQVELVEEAQLDDVITTALAQNWYPEYYSSMMKKNKIDLDTIRPEYGFDSGSVSGQVGITLKDVHVSYPYKGVTKTGTNKYVFTDTPIIMIVRSPQLIAIQYINENGLPVAYNFVSLQDFEILENLKALEILEASENLETDFLIQINKAFYVNQIIEAEKNRRIAQYHKIVNLGPAFSSSSYGRLIFTNDETFTWRGYQPLIKSGIIPSTSGSGSLGSGTVSVKYFIDSEISGQFDGVLTFRFDGTNNEVNFLYKLETTGLRLENVENSAIRNGTLMTKSNSPLVMFFAKIQ